MKIYVASGNKHKIEELKRILAPSGAELFAYPDYSAIDVEETGGTFEENAAIKAEYLSRMVDDYVIADDSGIEVLALGGAPGVHSARYAGENASDEDNNRLLLESLCGADDRRAKFVAVIALAKGGETVGLFRGECEGVVGLEAKGTNGFGYDPLFVLPDGRTMAELTPDEKNEISHRRRAAERLCEYLSSNTGD